MTLAHRPVTFELHPDYDGLVAVVDDQLPDGRHAQTRLYGWTTGTNSTNGENDVAVVPDTGASFGYIAQGAVTVWDRANRNDGILLRDQRWFALPDGCRLHLHRDSRVVVAQRVDYQGLRTYGGPIEQAGRLRYIDGCSDTLLACPPLLGDPCLNYLHFPPDIAQTFHTHPSVRCGAIARGLGRCEAYVNDGHVRHIVSIDLTPGSIWIIPAGCEHRFITDDQPLDVIAYHPDSDWGPTDQAHPMLNRTWVDGETIDNTGDAHAPKELVR